MIAVINRESASADPKCAGHYGLKKDQTDVLREIEDTIAEAHLKQEPRWSRARAMRPKTVLDDCRTARCA